MYDYLSMLLTDLISESTTEPGYEIHSSSALFDIDGFSIAGKLRIKSCECGQ